MKRIVRLAGIFVASVLGVLLLAFSAEAKSGAVEGILLCGRVVIPSLFPFTVCVLYLQNADFLRFFDRISPITRVAFGLNGRGFGIWILSLLGGYPIGAKVLNQCVKNGEISPKSAGKMLGFCVNAGPAFIITAVGVNVFGSKEIGLILLAAHIGASLEVLALNRFLYGRIEIKGRRLKVLNFADNFVLSTANAASTLMTICSFVVLFSTITAFVKMEEKLFGLGLLLEVTNAVNSTGNVYLISFLLGFGGVSIWCQILAVAKEIKINFLHFVLCRVLNGLLSAGLVAVMFKFFDISVPTFSLGGMEGEVFISTPQIAVSLLSMAIVFVISITAKNFAGKIYEDIV